MKGLIIELENTPEGSRELDFKISKKLGLISPDAKRDGEVARWLEAENLPRYVSGNCRCVKFSHYTTSLDAKVPGENIIEMHRDEDEWNAWHEGKLGKLFMGTADTEILARRIAGLRGIMAVTEKETKP